MAIRIRTINGVMVALCAARSVEKEGDIYLDDGIHHALSTKFALDFNGMFDSDLPHEENLKVLTAQEETVDNCEGCSAEEWERHWNNNAAIGD